MTSINHAEVAETLHRAADLIEERGWTYGEGWNHEDGGPLCLEGGILAAAGLSRRQDSIYDCPAYKAVRAYLDDRAPFLWNDNQFYARVNNAINDGALRLHTLNTIRAEASKDATTEVIATLRAAAAIEQAKHGTELPPIQRFEDGSWSVTLPAGWRAATVRPASDTEDAWVTSW